MVHNKPPLKNLKSRIEITRCTKYLSLLLVRNLPLHLQIYRQRYIKIIKLRSSKQQQSWYESNSFWSVDILQNTSNETNDNKQMNSLPFIPSDSAVSAIIVNLCNKLATVLQRAFRELCNCVTIQAINVWQYSSFLFHKIIKNPSNNLATIFELKIAAVRHNLVARLNSKHRIDILPEVSKCFL